MGLIVRSTRRVSGDLDGVFMGRLSIRECSLGLVSRQVGSENSTRSDALHWNSAVGYRILELVEIEPVIFSFLCCLPLSSLLSTC